MSWGSIQWGAVEWGASDSGDCVGGCDQPPRKMLPNNATTTAYASTTHARLAHDPRLITRARVVLGFTNEESPDE